MSETRSSARAIFSSADRTEFLGPAYYASMGFAVPAALGAQLARPDLRPLVLVGDGAFQMTGMELSTIARCGLNPVVVVLNNAGYGTERHIHDGPFNDVLNWNYHRLPDLLGCGRAFLVKTETRTRRRPHRRRRAHGKLLPSRRPSRSPGSLRRPRPPCRAARQKNLIGAPQSAVKWQRNSACDWKPQPTHAFRKAVHEVHRVHPVHERETAFLKNLLPCEPASLSSVPRHLKRRRPQRRSERLHGNVFEK